MLTTVFGEIIMMLIKDYAVHLKLVPGEHQFL